MWDPFREVERIEKDIEYEFKRFFKHNEDYFVKTRGLKKALSSFKNKGKIFEVGINLPGVDKKDIIIRAHNRVVEVKAEKSHNMEINKKGFFSRSRSFGEYYKVIPLPNGSDVDRLKSKFKKGILKITIPKKKEKKHISVKIK